METLKCLGRKKSAFMCRRHTALTVIPGVAWRPLVCVYVSALEQVVVYSSQTWQHDRHWHLPVREP